MGKKLYYQFSDNEDVCEIVMDLSGCMEWIKNDSQELAQHEFEEKEYTLTPIYITEEEFENLPEADI